MDTQNAKILSDYKGMTGQMESRCKTFENRERMHNDRTNIAKERILESRRKIHAMHEKRAEKEYAIERNEFKIKSIESRLKTVEQRFEHSRSSLRVDNTGSEKLIAKQKILKDSFVKQSELQAKIIRGMRRKDVLEKQLQSAHDKESRYRERVKSLVDRLKYLVGRQEEKKKSIRSKVENIKRMHAAIFEIEPKLRESHTRMRKIEVYVFDVEERVNRKEDEVRKIHKDIGYTKEEAQRTTTEIQVKKERTFRGPDALKQLAMTTTNTSGQ